MRSISLKHARQFKIRSKNQHTLDNLKSARQIKIRFDKLKYARQIKTRSTNTWLYYTTQSIVHVPAVLPRPSKVHILATHHAPPKVHDPTLLLLRPTELGPTQKSSSHDWNHLSYLGLFFLVPLARQMSFALLNSFSQPSSP